jgi:hypothetical protein
MEAAVKRPLKERINFRLIIFLAVIAIPFVWVFYVIINQTVTGGVEDYGSYKKVDLKSLGNFPFSAESGTKENIPPRWRALDGQRVLLQGEMYAGNSAAQVNDFQLVYSIVNCCFNGPPKVQERVFAKLPGEQTAPIYPGLVRVTGTLHIDIQRVEGQAVSVYTLDVEKIEPV